jgi:hypothetical protein
MCERHSGTRLSFCFMNLPKKTFFSLSPFGSHSETSRNLARDYMNYDQRDVV